MSGKKYEVWVVLMAKGKICGLTSTRDAEKVCETGADFAGVITQVDVSTPREVGLEKAEEIVETVSEDVRTVLVTMVEESDGIKNLERKVNPDYIQLHSDLSKSQLRDLEKDIDTGIIGIVSIPSDLENPEKVISKAKRREEKVDILLLDTKGAHEGGRMTHNWDISSKIRESVEVPIILAGGLTPDNVEKSIEKVDPYAVDVASGVESDPGKKSFELVEDFIKKGGN